MGRKRPASGEKSVCRGPAAKMPLGGRGKFKAGGERESSKKTARLRKASFPNPVKTTLNQRKASQNKRRGRGNQTKTSRGLRSLTASITQKKCWGG